MGKPSSKGNYVSVGRKIYDVRTKKARDPARTLTYRFLSLPHVVRLEIALALKLLHEEDEGIQDAILFERILQRAAVEKRLAALWDEVEARHDVKQPTNLFVRTVGPGTARRGGPRSGLGRKPEPQHPKLLRVGPTPLQADAAEAGGYATPYFLGELGYRLSHIRAAVRRGELVWTRDGVLEVAPRAG